MSCENCKNWLCIGNIEEVHKVGDEIRKKLGEIPPVSHEDKNIYGYCKNYSINALKTSETTCGSYSRKLKW